MAESADEYFRDGLDAYREGDFERALRHFTFGLATDKNHFGLHLYRGMTFARLNQVQEAKQEFLFVRDLAPDNELRTKAAAALSALSPGTSQQDIKRKKT